MKLGPHIILPSAPALNWAVRAPIVKAIDNVDVLREAQPNAIRVFRHFFPNQNLSDPVGTANAVLLALNGYRHPRLYVELWNEAHPTYAQLRDAVKICRAAGVKVAGGSWGTGDYDGDDWRFAVLAGVDALAVHCYWGSQGFTEWEALRYRTFWRPGNPPVLITECGRDAVEGGAAGWQKSGLSQQQYVSELLAYAAEIEKDTGVLGATVFTAGPTPDWQAFSTDSFSDQMPGGEPPATAGDTPVVYSSPNHDGPRAVTLGVVLHSTRGNAVSEAAEFAATVDWFNSSASQVSAHSVCGLDGEALPVDPANIAWHCRARNQKWLGLEMVQPKRGDPIPDPVLDRAAQRVAAWHKLYGFPLQWSLDSGLCEHWETPEGQADGKTDVQAPFDRADFLARVQRYAGDTPVTDQQKQELLAHLGVLWGSADQVKTVADVAKSAVLDTAQATIRERAVAIKKVLGLT